MLIKLNIKFKLSLTFLWWHPKFKPVDRFLHSITSLDYFFTLIYFKCTKSSSINSSIRACSLIRSSRHASVYLSCYVALFVVPFNRTFLNNLALDTGVRHRIHQVRVWSYTTKHFLLSLFIGIISSYLFQIEYLCELKNIFKKKYKLKPNRYFNVQLNDL